MRRRREQRFANQLLHDDVPVQERQHGVRLGAQPESWLRHDAGVQIWLVPTAAYSGFAKSGERDRDAPCVRAIRINAFIQVCRPSAGVCDVAEVRRARAQMSYLTRASQTCNGNSI